MKTPVRHILILIHGLGGGGAERSSVNLATIWAASGNRVTIATLRGAEPVPYLLPPSVRLLPLGVAGNSEGKAGALLANLRRILRVRRLLREERPDIAIGMMSTSAILLALARDRRTFLIGSERSYPPRDPIGRSWNLLRKFLYRRLDALVAQTEKTRDWLMTHTYSRHVVVIPNPILLPLPIREPYRSVREIVPADRKLLLSAGRLSQEKNFSRLIRDFGDVAAHHPDWMLVIIGEGMLRSELERLVFSLGLEDQVKLPGWAGNLSDWYHAADLYAMTSLYEGFPNVLLEAMAHGCSVISVDCDTGPRDLIQNGFNGVLVPSGEPRLLANALDSLMENDELRARLACEAIAVRTRYAPQQINELWQKLFVRQDSTLRHQKREK